MATRGRKPKPTAMKELEGNPGKHPLNTSEPKPNKKAPACPKWLEIVFWSALCHQLPPPPSRFSISSAASAGPPSEAMIRLREDGVRPNCSANLFMIFR